MRSKLVKIKRSILVNFILTLSVLLLLKNSFIKEHVLYMQCDSKEEFSKSLQILIQNDVLVYSLAEVHQDLETYYKELYKG